MTPPVTSGLALCVRVGKEERREGRVAGAAGRAGCLCSRPIHEPLR